MALKIRSNDFHDGGAIPIRFTQDAENVPPDLEWSNVPENTKSLALIVDDPDAPDPKAPKMTYVHWVLFDMPPESTGIKGASLPSGTRAGKNDAGKLDWVGPAPPRGRHRYFFKLYALDAVLPDLGAATKAQLEKALAKHVLEKAELVGTYQKKK